MPPNPKPNNIVAVATPRSFIGLPFPVKCALELERVRGGRVPNFDGDCAFKALTVTGTTLPQPGVWVVHSTYWQPMPCSRASNASTSELSVADIAARAAVWSREQPVLPSACLARVLEKQ